MRIGKPLFLSLMATLLLSGTAAAAGRDMIITFRHHPGVAEEALVRQAGGRIERRFDFINAAQVNVPEGAVESLRSHPSVASLEANGTVSIAPPVVKPLSSRSAMRLSGAGEYDASWGIRRIGADVLHDMAIKGNGVKVAILDTGIDPTHPDLPPIVEGENFIHENSNDPRDDNTGSHGTHVAGIIAATGNGKGVVGVAPGVELYVAKVLGGDGSGDAGSILDGFQWAIERKVDIINASFELPVSEAMKDALDRAEEAGILVVAASGNTGKEMSYPAAYDRVIFVTATDRNDAFALFSSFGPRVDFAAPGIEVTSTIRGGGYGELSGTSMAAPHVTGAAALLLSAGPRDLDGDGKNDVDAFRVKLQQMAFDLGQLGYDSHFGFGLAQATPNFALSRTGSHAGRDARTMTLAEGTYEIVLRNTGLSAIIVRVFDERGVLVGKQSRVVRFKRRGPAIAYLDVDAAVPGWRIEFTPLGPKGANAHVRLAQQL